MQEREEQDRDVDAAFAEADRVCRALKGQIESAKALVVEARAQLLEAQGPRRERRSFQPPRRPGSMN